MYLVLGPVNAQLGTILSLSYKIPVDKPWGLYFYMDIQKVVLVKHTQKKDIAKQ